LRGGSSFKVILDNINVYECGINSSLILNDTITNASMAGSQNGSITVSPLGGVAPYTFQWSTGFNDTGSSSTLLNSGSGLYSVTVTDAFGDCTLSASYNIGTVSTDQFSNLTNLDIYPNPTSATLNVDIDLATAQALDVRIFNTLGQTMWNTKLAAEEQHNLPISVSDFNTGIYFIQLSSTSGQITKRFIVE